MNLAETNHHIKIAEQQAGISQGKHNAFKKEGHEYKAKLYWVRWQALRTYIASLKAEKRKYERKAFKKANGDS